MRRIGFLFLLIVVLVGGAVLASESNCSVEAFFVSPDVDHTIQYEILNAIESAEHSLFIAMYSFTDDKLGDAVVEAYQKRKVDVRILLDGAQGSGTNGKEWPKLKAAGIPIIVEDVTGALHDKFAVIDHNLVITGSYNWSARADEQNFENVVFIRCEQIAQEYEKEFFRIWNSLSKENPSHPLGQKLFIELVSVTSPVQQGGDATITVRTLPGAECNIRVKYKSGWSTAAGLYSKKADEKGLVSWTWAVSPRTSPGTWMIYVTAKLNEENANLKTTFTVTEDG